MLRSKLKMTKLSDEYFTPLGETRETRHGAKFCTVIVLTLLFLTRVRTTFPFIFVVCLDLDLQRVTFQGNPRGYLYKRDRCALSPLSSHPRPRFGEDPTRGCCKILQSAGAGKNGITGGVFCQQTSSAVCLHDTNSCFCRKRFLNRPSDDVSVVAQMC